MGRADFYDHGNANKICDKCGQKYKASELQEQWDHTWACSFDWELRQPQDRLRSFPDRQTIEDARPESTGDITFWDGSSLVEGENDPSTDSFLTTNEVQSDDLGTGNGSICTVAPTTPECP